MSSERRPKLSYSTLLFYSFLEQNRNNNKKLLGKSNKKLCQYSCPRHTLEFLPALLYWLLKNILAELFDLAMEILALWHYYTLFSMSTMFTIHYTMLTMHTIVLCSLYYTLFTILYYIQYAMCTILYYAHYTILFSLYYVMFNIHYTMITIHCLIFTILYYVHYAL